jgi:hypothetical protein
MESTVIVAIITGFISIIIASLIYYFTKKQQIDKEWRDAKINHYKVLLSSLSDLAVDGKNKDEANRNFSLAVNTICLVAPQYVITALMNFHDEIKFTNQNKSQENHDKFLIKLLLEIRKDIKISTKDKPDSFNFHLIGSSPKRV